MKKLLPVLAFVLMCTGAKSQTAPAPHCFLIFTDQSWSATLNPGAGWESGGGGNWQQADYVADDILPYFDRQFVLAGQNPDHALGMSVAGVTGAVYLKKEFIIGANIGNVFLNFSGRCKYDIYVNGALVFTSNGITYGYKGSIGAYLVAGNNIICVKASDAFGIGAVGWLQGEIYDIAPFTPAITANAETVGCSSPPGGITLTAGTGGLSAWHWYQGSCGGTPVGTGPSITVSPSTTTTYYARGETGCMGVGNCGFITITRNNITTVNISSNPSGIICAGYNVTFTASVPTGNNLSYQWKLNDVNAGTNAPNYSNATLVDNDVVKCEVSNGCNTVTSNSLNMPVNLVPSSVTISMWQNQSTSICLGGYAAFAAVATNSGAHPTYKWKKNGVVVQTYSGSFTDNTSYYETNSLNNFDTITCEMISQIACTLPAASNKIGITVAPGTSRLWYLDGDGDGYYNGSYIIDCSSPGPGYTTTVIAEGDCDDNNAAAHQSFLFYEDADHDGYGTYQTTVCAVNANTPPLGYSLNSGDCDDANPSKWQYTGAYYDGDGDGYGNYNFICYGITLPPGYSLSTLGADCDDNDNTVWQTVNFYLDTDGDGYFSNFTQGCFGATVTIPPGYNTTSNLGPDCNDNDNTVWQGGYFYIDNDEDGYYGDFVQGCFGATLPPHYYHYDGSMQPDCNDNDNSILGGTLYYADVDGDGYGNTNSSTTICGTDHTGYVLDNSDCNDNDATIHPGAVDICNNGIDEDCNGVADDQPITYYADADGDTYGDPLTSTQTCDPAPAGYVTNNSDCDDTNIDAHPGAAEIEGNGIDDNCDGLIDTKKLFRDVDGDGYGDPAVFITDNFSPGYYYDITDFTYHNFILDSTDCNDNNFNIHPSAQEICDGLDNDCNGIVDDNVAPTYAYIDRDGDGYTDFSLYRLVNCSGGSYNLPPNYIIPNSLYADCDDNNAAINPGAIENLTNGIDDNCDGLIDVLPNNCDWNGSVSANWQDPANWDCNAVPTGISIVNIPFVANQPQLTADAAVYKLISSSDATVDLNGHELSMSGESYGTVFKGSPTSSLNYENNGSGYIVMDQTTDGASNTLANLTLNTNSIGFVQLQSKLIIINSIVPNKGRVYTNNNELVLRSTATKTASIAESHEPGNYIAGPVTVERYIPNNNFRSWRLLSVPTHYNGQSIRQAWQEGDINPNPQDNNLPGYGTQITGTGNLATAQAAGFDNTAQLPALLTWNGTGWTGAGSTNNPIDDKQAYFLYIRGERSKGVSSATSNSSATTLRTRGNVYMGNQDIAVTANSFTLVPNLYASAIDFTRLTRTGVNNLFYIWDSKKQNGNSLGVYQTFSATNGFNCLISGGSYTPGQPNTLIESGQAFFVQGNTGGSITLHESSKIQGNSGLGFRPAPSSLTKLESRLYNDDGTTMRDASTIVFDDAYNDDVDAEDAPKIGNPGENFALENSSKILTVEGRKPLKDADVVQFRMWNLKQQQYTLELAAMRMNNEGLTAMLKDSYLKTSTPVDLAGTTILRFGVDADPASAAANRFRLVFKKTVVNDKPYVKVYPNPIQGNTINLQFTNERAGRYTLRLLNTNGQTIFSKNIMHPGGSCNQPFNLPANIASGAYEVEITDPNKEKQAQILMINKQ